MNDTALDPAPSALPRYTYTAMALHWLVALLIVCGFTLGLVMTDIPGFTPAKLRYFSYHKWLGVTVLVLVAARAVWRLAHPAPALQGALPAWQKWAAAATHRLLYVVMFLAPASGYLYSSAANVPVVYLGLVPLPRIIDPNPALKPWLREAHEVLVYGLAALVALHVLAALKHQFIDRDGLIGRMLPTWGRARAGLTAAPEPAAGGVAGSVAPSTSQTSGS